MENEKQSAPEGIPEPGSSYFELQADWGITKHPGGLKATEELAELCHINEDKLVLVVGCGVGVTPCYLAKRHGCKAFGIDISEKMVNRSKERAKRQGVDHKVEFRVADAQNLPFEDNFFDAVISESVNAFIEDRPRAASEYVRVTKPGGYVGLNEATWIKTPPSELPEYLYRVMGAKFPPRNNGWKELLADSGLREITARVYKINAFNQWLNEVRQFEFLQFLRAWYKFWSMFIQSPACRKFIREALAIPRGIFGLFQYWGYGIYAGRK